MTVSAAFIELLRDLLSPLGPITIKKMFGGATLYADDLSFGIIDDDVLYVKADATNKPTFDAEGLGAFTYQGQTGPVSMSYYRVPERCYDDGDEMCAFASAAIAAARRTKKPKAAKPKSKPFTKKKR